MTKSDQTNDQVLDNAAVSRLYNRIAPIYNALSKPYGWIGGRAMVTSAFDQLQLQPGHTVVDLGTGTGRNLPELAARLGPTGTVIGVDLSSGMLQQAQRRLDKLKAPNIELVNADITDYSLPSGTNAVLATFAIEMLPNYDVVIANLSQQLAPDGRIAVTGLRHPERWPTWITNLGSIISRPFGVNKAYRQHQPWKSIATHTINSTYQEACAGVMYLAVGQAGRRDRTRVTNRAHA